MIIRVSPAEMARIRAKVAERKAKKEEKRKDLPWGKRQAAAEPEVPRNRRKKTERQVMRDRLDAIWSEAVRLRDRKLYGPLCRICHKDPATVGYHIVPKKRGDAIRWLLENGIGGCAPCNGGERWNPGLYRDKHISLLGKDLVERLEAKAREHADFSMDDLKRIYSEIKAFVEAQGKT